MSIFWTLAITLSLLALAFVLPPLLRRKPPATAATDNQINTEVARQRLAELEQDLAAGRLDQARYATARADLERELLNDLKEDAAAKRPAHSGRWAAVLIAIALPVCAAVLYKVLGSEQIIAMLQQQPAAGVAAARAPNGMTVQEMVSRLADRLKQDPDNLKGWTMLAKSYTVMERFDLAVPAYRNVMRLGGGKNAGVLADFADALVASSNGRFSDETGKLLTQALQLDPENIKALWLAGHWKHQNGDTRAALEYWEHAARLLPPNGEDSKIIHRQIAQARQEAGLPPLAETQPASTAQGGGTSLQVKVALDPSLKDKAAPDDTVFIYARAASGPPMPLAIARKQVKDLPLTVTLDDSMAMAPGMNLSRFPELTVGARISKSGNAMPQNGDLQGLKTPVHPADTHSLDILIDQVVGSGTQVAAVSPGTAAAATTPATGGGTSLHVKVALDPSLTDKTAPDDTVFIYARAASGPPMPLAIVRKQVKDLPLTVTLDDSMAMVPSMNLSRFPELTVGARVSKSGNAMPQSGDLQGLKTPVRPAATPDLDLVIDQVVH